MSHPNRKEGVVGHNAKLKRMTRDYGAADPDMVKMAPVDKYMKNGSEESVGFGATDGAATARGDKPARKSSAANPIATYKAGGRVRNMGGSVIGGNVAARAMGGRLEGELGSPGSGGGMKSRTRGKPSSTNVNIIVAPQGQPPAAPAALPEPPAGPPPPPPGAGPGGPGGMPPGMPPSPGMIPPGAMPPGLPQLPRAAGGRTNHPDAAADKKLVKGMVKSDCIKRARGGALTGGAESGPGRLEKSADRARRQAGDKSAEV